MKKNTIITAAVTAILIICINNQGFSADNQTTLTKQETEKNIITTNTAASETKSLENRTIIAAKSAENKTAKAVKSAADKTTLKTKQIANKAAKATKEATKKTVESTKNITNKAIDETKEFFDDLPTYKEITTENLEKEAAIKKIKYEKKELKAAYNSRIKDTNAKIKATEKSTLISETERRNRIHLLNMQVSELEKERDTAIKKYDLKLKEIRNKK